MPCTSKTVWDKTLNVFRVVGHSNWGADKVVLLRIYRVQVRSKLDYGCIVCDTSCRPEVRTLDAVHHESLRICLGAFRTSTVQSLYVKAGEILLPLRSMRFTMNFMLKLHSFSDNLAHDCIVNSKFLSHFETQIHIITTSGICLQPHFQAAELTPVFSMGLCLLISLLGPPLFLF